MMEKLEIPQEIKDLVDPEKQIVPGVWELNTETLHKENVRCFFCRELATEIDEIGLTYCHSISTGGCRPD